VCTNGPAVCKILFGPLSLVPMRVFLAVLPAGFFGGFWRDLSESGSHIFSPTPTCPSRSPQRAESRKPTAQRISGVASSQQLGGGWPQPSSTHVASFLALSASAFPLLFLVRRVFRLPLQYLRPLQPGRSPPPPPPSPLMYKAQPPTSGLYFLPGGMNKRGLHPGPRGAGWLPRANFPPKHQGLAGWLRFLRAFSSLQRERIMHHAPISSSALSMRALMSLEGRTHADVRRGTGEGI
jgi:hypothetical protein